MSDVRFVDSNGLSILVFDPSMLGLAIQPSGNGKFRPLKLSEVMAREDVLAALDGTMFSNCDPGSNFRTLRCADPDYAVLDRARGVFEQSNRGKSDDGLSLWIVDGKARWTRGGSIDSQASVGVQMYPSLVMNGVVSRLSTGGSNSQSLLRAGVLGFPDGSIGFAKGFDSLQGFADRCHAAGAIWGGYTDGGTSTSMGLRLPDGTFRRWGMSAENERPVAMFLIARRPAAKSLMPLVVGVAAVAAIGLGVWAYRRRALLEL